MGFDGPGEGGLVEFGEESVGAEGVEVFGVEEEAVHVEEAGEDGGWGWGHGGWVGVWKTTGNVLVRLKFAVVETMVDVYIEFVLVTEK